MRGDFAGLQGKRSPGAAGAPWLSDSKEVPTDMLFSAISPGLPAMMLVKETPVVPFFVQIKCQLGKSYAVANALADAEIASEIYSTAGDFDLLVKFYVEPGTDIGHFVNEKVQCIAGIHDTRTIITFKAF